MMMNDPTEGLMIKISEWIVTMTVLNLLWLLLTLLGGVLLGWAPATVAIMAVWRQKARTTDKVPLVKTMWEAYWQNFLKANAIGWILKLCGALLIFYSFTLSYWEGVIMLVFWVLFSMIVVIFMIVGIFVFSVYIHYDLKFVMNFRYAFLIGLSHLHFVGVMAVTIAVVFWVYTLFPGLMLVFAVSFPSMCITQLALVVFGKIEDKQAHYSNQE